jgi:hypothetical protein
MRASHVAVLADDPPGGGICRVYRWLTAPNQLFAGGLHGRGESGPIGGLGEQREAQMLINRPVKVSIALVLGGAAVVAAAQSGTQALGAQPGARLVSATAGSQGNSDAVPPDPGAAVVVGGGGNEAGRGAAVAGALLPASGGCPLQRCGDECLRGRGLRPVLTDGDA